VDGVTRFLFLFLFLFLLLLLLLFLSRIARAFRSHRAAVPQLTKTTNKGGKVAGSRRRSLAGWQQLCARARCAERASALMTKKNMHLSYGKVMIFSFFQTQTHHQSPIPSPIPHHSP
jgi:hypothetical protein